MTTSNKKKIRIQFFLILGSFLAAYLCFSLLPNVFEIWNSQAVDQLFSFRASSDKFRLPYDKTVAYVDFNNSSIRQLNHLFLDRSHYAQVIRNLKTMRVSAMVFDFIFAGRLTKGDDDAFIREINIAYRIESFTIGGQILISPGTYDKIQSIVRLKSTKQVQFKGVDHPVDIYDVVALERRYAVKLPQKKKEKLSELNPSLPIDCFVLDEKTISDTAITGEIIQLGETVAEAVLKETVAAHANLRILITPEENNSLSEVYAKVLPSDAHDYQPSQNSVHLQFTWLPEEVKAYLAERRSAGQR